MAARIATEMVIELRFALRSLGVPLTGPSFMFGDNQSVVANTTLPSSSLKKKHNAIAYHKVRESIAAKLFHFVHVAGQANVADILTKPLGPKIHQRHVGPLLLQNPHQVSDHGEYQDPDRPTVDDGLTGDQSFPWYDVTSDITTSVSSSERTETN